MLTQISWLLMMPADQDHVSGTQQTHKHAHTHTHTHESTHTHLNLCLGGRFFLLLLPLAPCLAGNRSTPGRTMMKQLPETFTRRGELEKLWHTVTKTCSYHRAAVAKCSKRQQNLTDCELPGIIRLLPVPLRAYSMFCYGLLLSVMYCCLLPVLLRLNK